MSSSKIVEPATDVGDQELTRRVAEIGHSISIDTVPQNVIDRVKCSFLDWLGAAFAGSGTPLAAIIRNVTLRSAGVGEAGIIGEAFQGVGPVDAALINGTTSHALELDDGAGRELTFGVAYHPSVSMMPAALALAQSENASGTQFMEAVIAAQETAIRIAGFIGVAHRDAGWHATGTIGSFGAAAAGAKLLGLDVESWQMALGIVGTQTAGLRAVFGTMCKPFHAGKAASNGVLAALLANEGFTSTPDILGARYGFGWTESVETHPERAKRPLGSPFQAETASFKEHASCGGTHCTIEAMRHLVTEQGLVADAVERIIIRVPAPRMTSCNIASPQTALQGKFSLRFTATAALFGWDTSGGCFTDAAVTSPDAVEIMRRITVEGFDLPTVAGPTEIEVVTKDGRHLVYLLDEKDYHGPSDWKTLAPKYLRLASPVVGEKLANYLLETIEDLEHLDSMRSIHQALRTNG